MSRRKRRRLKKNKKGFSIVVFVVIAFCACIGVRIGYLKKQSDDLAQKKAVLEQELKDEEQRTKDLQELEKYMQTKKYMEDVAKDKLGLVYPDEILIEPENK